MKRQQEEQDAFSTSHANRIFMDEDGDDGFPMLLLFHLSRADNAFQSKEEMEIYRKAQQYEVDMDDLDDEYVLSPLGSQPPHLQ